MSPASTIPEGQDEMWQSVRSALWAARSRGERAIIFASIVLAAVAMFTPTWPWFAIGSVLLLLLSILVAVPGARRRVFRGHPARAWSLLVVLTWGFVLHGYYVELHRQRSERLDVLGVEFPRRQSATLSIGVDDSVDVRLQRAEDPTLRWRIGVRELPDGRFAVEEMRGVDAIQQQEPLASRVQRLVTRAGIRQRRWPHLLGAALSAESDKVRLIATASDEVGLPATESDKVRLGGTSAAPLPSGATREHTFQLHLERGHAELDWNGVRLPLRLPEHGDPAVQVRNTRLHRELRRGVELGRLPWPSIPDTTLARDVVLTLVSAPRASLAIADPLHLLPRWELRLTARDRSWIVQPAPGSDEKQNARGLPILDAGDSIRVSARGTQWVFVLEARDHGAYGARDFAVGFGRRPDPRLGWLPAAEVCRPLERCTLVSSRALAPSIPHFDLSGFGLDTATFEFLARVAVDGNSYRIITPGEVHTVPLGQSVLVPAQSTNWRLGNASYRLRVHKIASGELIAVALTIVALALVLGGAGLLTARSERVAKLLAQDTIAVNTAWAVASVAVVLLGLRLALGLRVTYAAPYHERDISTAVGMWVVVTLLTAALLRWESWGPRVVDRLLRLEGLVRIGNRTALGPVLESNTGSYEVPTLSRIPRGVGLFVLGGGLALLGWLRPEALVRSAIIIGFVLLAWVIIEYLSARHVSGLIAPSAGSILADGRTDNDPGRRLALGVVTVGIPFSVLVRDGALPLTLGLLVLLLLGAVVSAIQSRRDTVRRLPERIEENVVGDAESTPSGAFPAYGLAPENDISAPPRWGAVTVVLLFLVVLNVAMVLAGGPTLLFVGVFFLFLLSVRTGHHLVEAFTKRLSLRAGAPLAALGLALLLVLPIDFGLLLVLSVPLAVTLLLTLGADRVPLRSWALLAALFIAVGWISKPVLWPDVTKIQIDQRAHETSEQFAALGGPLRSWPVFEDPVRRSVVRGLASFHPEILELVLARAGPSPAREELIPAREHIWGGRAYAASGLTGHGLAGPTVIGRGVPEVVSDAENTFSVYVLAEHGLLGGLAVLAAYAVLVCVALAFLWSVWMAPAWRARPNDTATAVLVGGILMITVPAAYVAASNLALVPLTGQNMPFLGLNAWSDVAFIGALLSAMFAVLLDTRLLTNERAD